MKFLLAFLAIFHRSVIAFFFISLVVFMVRCIDQPRFEKNIPQVHCNLFFSKFATVSFFLIIYTRPKCAQLFVSDVQKFPARQIFCYVFQKISERVVINF